MVPEKTVAQAARGADPGIQEANLGKAVQTEKKKKKMHPEMIVQNH